MSQFQLTDIKRPTNPPVLPTPQAVQSQGNLDIATLQQTKKKTLGLEPGKPVGTKAWQPPTDTTAAKPELTSAKDLANLLYFAEKLGAAAPPQPSASGTTDLGPSAITNSTQYPWRAIGKVFVGENNNFASPIWTGSGCLVGPNLLLTASHVAPWDRAGGWMRFVPAYYNSAEPYGSSYVAQWRGVKFTGAIGKFDYVVCSLYTPIGYTVGWLGTHWWGDDSNYTAPHQWLSVGYPGDSFNAQVPMLEQQINVKKVIDDGTLGKELDTSYYAHPGWSGGPTWAWFSNQPLAVAVMSGWESFTDGSIISIASGGEEMVDLVIWAEQNWPPPPPPH